MCVCDMSLWWTFKRKKKHGFLPLFAQDFVHARQLFSACLELVTEFSPKLRQVMLNEMLLLEVRAHETMAAEGSKERPPPDLVSRVRGYLEMRIHGETRNSQFLSSKNDKTFCTSLTVESLQGFDGGCFAVSVSCRCAFASGGWGGVCCLHVELAGE